MRNFRRRLDRTKPLRLDHPVDSHLKPVKDSDGNLCPLEISTDKIRVKDFEVTGTATGITHTDDTKLPLSGGTMAGELDMGDNIISDIKRLEFNDGDANITEIKDEDDMASDSATMLATQQSIKAYVDSGDDDGWHGSATRVKILHSDFIADDGGRPVQIDDTGSDRWIESDRTSSMFASVPIPTGYTATHVNIYGSATSTISVYEADIDSKTVTSKGAGNIGTEIDITDVASDTTNYILIQMAQASGEEVYGGYMTIAAS